MTRSGVRSGGRLLAAASLAVGAAVAAQDAQNPPHPVFRAGANFVAVDVYPTHDGRLVENLSRDDFDVLEDGKPQRVEEFEFVSGAHDGPNAVWPPPTRLEDAAYLAGDPHRRVFVMFLTGYHASWEGAQNARAATEAFFSQSVGPSDLFGVLRPYEPVVDLTLGERPEDLTNEAMSYWDWASLPHPDGWPKHPAEQDIYNCLSRFTPDIEKLLDAWRPDKLLATLDELTVRLASMREGRSNILVFSGSWGVRLQLWDRTPDATAELRAQQIGTQGPPAIALPVRPGDACDAEYHRLQNADFARRLSDLAATARRGDVAISFVDPAGLSIFDDDIRATKATSMKAVLDRYENVKTLALVTGGTSLVGATELGPALVKFAGEQSGHYQLGYYSSNNKFDGKFRLISVRVRQPGVSVVARKGYQAPTAEMFRASQSPSAPAKAPGAAVQAIAELERVSPDARLYGHAARRGDHVVVVAEIASGQLTMGRWADGGAVEARLLGPNQTPAGSAHGEIAKGTRAASIDVPLADAGRGPWTASIHVTGSGELAVAVDVPSTPSGLLGDPLVFRALARPNAPLQPVADFAFLRTERLHVQWPVLKTLDQRQARLLDQRGQPLPVNAGVLETRNGDATTLSADVTLTPLAASTYVVEVSVGSGATTEQRYVAFRVVR